MGSKQAAWSVRRTVACFNSAEDWEQAQETLHILQNTDRMRQIAQSSKIHSAQQGYQPTAQAVAALLGV
ncbi:MAG: hypothetical protein HC910_21445 [Spirulinaceae cyanobacterium SM2_1_0]|nr:hypothetical protein [Spirulinaceae cyanobacterium SM2_1_0]